MSDEPVSILPGIGPVTRGRLEEAGIRTVSDLRAVGSVEAYRRLKFMLPRQVSLNALYGLEAALRGCHWLDLPPGCEGSPSKGGPPRRRGLPKTRVTLHDCLKTREEAP